VAKLAIDKAQAPEVKQFARRMLADHTKANTELKRIAEKKNLPIPTQLDAEHQAQIEKLSSLSGADFDKEYMAMMVDDHKDAVELFKKQADKGSDPDLKGFAMKTLPTLERHSDMARADKKSADREKTQL
jgi:putative membrane protein